MSNTKRRYYIFMGDLYKSQDGNWKSVKYTCGIVGAIGT